LATGSGADTDLIQQRRLPHIRTPEKHILRATVGWMPVQARRTTEKISTGDVHGEGEEYRGSDKFWKKWPVPRAGYQRCEAKQ